MIEKVSFKKVFLYMLPAIIITVVFFLFPLFFTVPVSLFSWDGISEMKFIGLKNFVYLFNDPSFKTALVNTILWILVAVFLHTPLGLLVAFILNRRPRGWKFFRTLFFLPNIISVTSLAILWYFLLHPSFGLINTFLRTIGLEEMALPWLSSSNFALISTQLPFILYIGFTMLIFYANISTIPEEYYEAAKLDGASSWQQDLYITIPLVRRTIGINILFNVAFILKMVEYPMIMTGGGPAGSTKTLPLYLYQKMVSAHAYGQTMAAGFVTFCIGMLVTFIVFLGLQRFNRRWGQLKE